MPWLLRRLTRQPPCAACPAAGRVGKTIPANSPDLDLDCEPVKKFGRRASFRYYLRLRVFLALAYFESGAQLYRSSSGMLRVATTGFPI